MVALTASVLGVGNTASLNPLSKGYDQGPTISRGGTKFVSDGSGNISPVNATMALGSGKWYWEHDLVSPATDGSTQFNSISIGVVPSTSPAATSMLRASSHYVATTNGLGWALRKTGTGGATQQVVVYDNTDGRFYTTASNTLSSTATAADGPAMVVLSES